jgi:hypothetical protein
MWPTEKLRGVAVSHAAIQAGTGNRMAKANKKPKKDVTSTKLSPAEWKYDAFMALWETYLHLRAWGQPEYEELQPEDKRYFKGLVAKGRQALLFHLEDCKLSVVRAGLGDQVRDEWLAILGLSDFDLAKGFPTAKRERLGKMLHEMYPTLLRLDPHVTPLAGLSRSDPVPDDLITTEVAISEYATSRATIRRKIHAGELHDYRAPGLSANSKLLMSRAELGRLFARRK